MALQWERHYQQIRLFWERTTRQQATWKMTRGKYTLLFYYFIFFHGIFLPNCSPANFHPSTSPPTSHTVHELIHAHEYGHVSVTDCNLGILVCMPIAFVIFNMDPSFNLIIWEKKQSFIVTSALIANDCPGFPLDFGWHVDSHALKEAMPGNYLGSTELQLQLATTGHMSLRSWVHLSLTT